MAKTKAEVAKMVRAQKIKQFSKLTLEQRKIKNGEIMRSARRNTAVGKIELSVLKKLILPEQKANKARTELKKTVPTTKKKVSRAELDKARVALQKKPVPKGSHRMPDGSIMKDSAMKKKPATSVPAPKKTGRTYQYTVYLPEDYSDIDALNYWEGSSVVSGKSGVELGKELRTENDNPLYDKGTYHVFTAKKLYTIKEWKQATKGSPTNFSSETGKNYGYRGGIVKKVSKAK